MTLAWWDVLTQTQQQHQKGLYMNIFDSLLVFIHVCSYCILFQFFLCSFFNLLRPALVHVHICIEGGSLAGSRDSGHINIFSHFFVSHINW